MLNEYLKEEFQKLSDEEKTALLIYKSRLGLLLNDLDNNPNYEEYYNYLIKIFNNPINSFIKTAVFKDIDLTSIETFKNKIKEIKIILDNVLGNIALKEDIDVYRAVSSDHEINGISKSNIISTSLSFATTLKFAQAGNNICLYKIKLHANDGVMCIPYSIKEDEKNNRLLLTSKDDQDEIILDKRQYDFQEISVDNSISPITIIELNAIKKKQRTL